MSDTPRTDAFMACEGQHKEMHIWDFARQLERELNIALASRIVQFNIPEWAHEVHVSYDNQSEHSPYGHIKG